MNILTNDDVSVAYLPLHKAILSAPAEPTAPYIRLDDEISVNGRKVAPWGPSNNFPQTVITELGKNNLGAPVLDWKVRALMGGGIVPSRFKGYNADFTDILEPIQPGDPLFNEIDDFFFNSNIESRYLTEAATDFYWFLNTFPEFIVSKNRRKITSITTQEATNCRWEVMNKKGIVENCLITANWPDPNSEEITVVPTFDIYNPSRLDEIRNGKYHKYIYPVSYPTPGKTYYQLAHWDGIRASGWLEIARLIPEWKKALMTNQVTVGFHVAIPSYWWKWKYKKWDEMTDAEKKTAREEEMQKFNDVMSGAENAGKTIQTTFEYDEHMKQERPGWKITPIDNRQIASGAYVEESQEAASHLLAAFGVDNTLITSPGKNMGAGSGSDKRVAFNIHLSLIRPHRICLTEPLQFIARYNGWGNDIRFPFRDTVIETLNTGTETKTKTSEAKS